MIWACRRQALYSYYSSSLATVPSSCKKQRVREWYMVYGGPGTEGALSGRGRAGEEREERGKMREEKGERREERGSDRRGWWKGVGRQNTMYLPTTVFCTVTVRSKPAETLRPTYGVLQHVHFFENLPPCLLLTTASPLLVLPCTCILYEYESFSCWYPTESRTRWVLRV